MHLFIGRQLRLQGFQPVGSCSQHFNILRIFYGSWNRPSQSAENPIRVGAERLGNVLSRQQKILRLKLFQMSAFVGRYLFIKVLPGVHAFRQVYIKRQVLALVFNKGPESFRVVIWVAYVL